MKLIYISQGNIPSKWAHTFQAMKMADALAAQVESLTLVTSRGFLSSGRNGIDCREWYGVSNRFKVVRLPVYWRVEEPFFTGWKLPRFDRAAALYGRIKSPDMVYTRSAFAGRCCVNLGLKTIIEFHMDVERSELFHIEAVRHKTHLLGVVTITAALKDRYVQSGLPAEKIFVWPDAVDSAAFDRLPARMIVRRNLGLPQDAFIATYCGHFYRDRGIEEIIACARSLPTVHFMMIGGWDNDRARCQEEARQLSNVHFTGFVPNRRVPDYLKASDVLLMPYAASCETAPWMSPLKLFEYMASGCPIVATDLPALRIHLTHGRNAHLIAPGDAAALAAALKTIKASRDYARSLGQAARRDVSPYTWENRARAVMARFCNGSTDGQRVIP